jgi:hypothetical protein
MRKRVADCIGRDGMMTLLFIEGTSSLGCGSLLLGNGTGQTAHLLPT